MAFLFGPWDTNDDNFKDYQQNYLDYCDIDTDTDIQNVDIDDASDCVRTGTRWLIVYKLCFAVTLLFTINACIMTLGAWSYPARMLGSCLFGLT